MLIDKIYDLSFWGRVFWFCFCFLFVCVFSLFPFCSNGAYRFSPKQFLTYQMLVNPEQVWMCVDLIYASVKCMGSRGEGKMQQKKNQNHVPMAPYRNTSPTLFYISPVMRRNENKFSFSNTHEKYCCASTDFFLYPFRKLNFSSSWKFTILYYFVNLCI